VGGVGWGGGEAGVSGCMYVIIRQCDRTGPAGEKGGLVEEHPGGGGGGGEWEHGGGRAWERKRAAAEIEHVNISNRQHHRIRHSSCTFEVCVLNLMCSSLSATQASAIRALSHQNIRCNVHTSNPCSCQLAELTPACMWLLPSPPVAKFPHHQHTTTAVAALSHPVICHTQPRLLAVCNNKIKVGRLSGPQAGGGLTTLPPSRCPCPPPRPQGPSYPCAQTRPPSAHSNSCPCPHPDLSYAPSPPYNHSLLHDQNLA